ncbi:unnamed protein product [Closterium sp. NIES-64]|nr:unnamed protein product [Closterium sp. NIES-64]
MDMAKKWVKLGGLGRSRRQSNRSCGDEVTCFNLRAPRGFRADSLPKIYFREAPIDVPDVVASDSVAADEVNAVKHASDVALSSPSNSHRLGPSSSSSADLSSFDLPNLESAEPSPAVEPATGRRGSPDGTQTCPERSLTGDDVEFCSRRAKTVPLDTHSAHSRRTGPRRSLTDQRGSERIGDGTVTETTTPAQRAFELAPVAEPCSPAIAGRPAPPVSTGLSRLMADLYGGEEDDSVGEGDLYGVAVLPASSKSGRRASISGGTGGFGGSSRRIAWEGANGDDYLSYPEDLYAVAFRSGPLPPSRSPAAFSRGGGGGGGGAGGPPARSPLSRNATMHMVPKQRSRRTFSQPSDFPGFQQDLGGSSSSAIGGCSLPRRSLTQPKLRAPSDPDLTGPSDTRAAGGQAYAEASIPEASTPESLFRGESSRGGSHRKGSFRGRPSEDQTSPLTADPTGVCYDSSSRGAGGQRRRGSASGREIGGGVRTPPAEGHRRIPSGASYDGREGGFEGEVRLKERAEGHRRNPSGASYDGIGAGEIDDELNGGDSREGFGSCAVTPKGGRVARRANASPLTSPHTASVAEAERLDQIASTSGAVKT